MNDLQLQINVPVTPAQAYKTISQVQEWWARNLEGNTSALGDEFTVRFGETFASFKVAQAEPGHKYVWHVTDCFLHWIDDKTEWKGTDLIWDVASAEGGSVITMVHRGLTPKVECYNDCKAGWEHFVMSSLYKLITEGKGLPEGQGVHA